MFDPRSLRMDASLNRTRLGALEGAEPEWVGQPAFELLSSVALVDLVQRAGEAAAGRIFGRRLGHLIATLHLGGDADAIQTEWRRAYRAHWRAIQQVWLGGGLAERLGAGLLAAARSEADRLGAARVSIRLSVHPASLALIGAARSSESDRAHAVVLDFGHTAIKRGVATYRNATLLRIELLEARRAPPAQRVISTVIEEIAEMLALAPRDVDPTLLVSLASYVSPSGEPEDSHSLYAPLRTLTPAALADSVRQHSGRPVERVRFEHDGTLAAAGLISGAPASAVIMLGTALGVGFAPSGDRLRAVATDFSVRATHGVTRFGSE